MIQSEALEQINDIPKFYLGQQVETEHGIGIIVSMNMPFNGLYIRPEVSECTVWYGMQDDRSHRWVSSTHKLTELKQI